jgi:hypothetical protein
MLKVAWIPAVAGMTKQVLVSQSSPHSMAGLDPAIQSHTLEHRRMLPWMAATDAKLAR